MSTTQEIMARMAAVAPSVEAMHAEILATVIRPVMRHADMLIWWRLTLFAAADATRFQLTYTPRSE